MLSNSGRDERGKYRGGKAGDQDGKEWAFSNGCLFVSLELTL